MLTNKLSNFSCCWYHKGTNFQANHNYEKSWFNYILVVADTTKVRIFKQITTGAHQHPSQCLLLLIPQRYEFSSKSQQYAWKVIFQLVVADTTKVRIFKQITTGHNLLIIYYSCCWYHKGTNFQANHNLRTWINLLAMVVADTTKVRIFKQITTTN